MIPRELLKSGAEELGVSLSIEQINSVFVYLAELRKWNQKINLTAIHDERDVIIKHVLDSLSYLKGFDPTSGSRLLDMGSGAGFPAFVIKIARPELAITLVESVKKKASFLRHIVRTLKLESVVVIDKRTDELPDEHTPSYDVVTARAFADMSAALSAGTAFLKPGGLMVLSRGPEENIGEPAMYKAGVALEQRIDLTLPHSDYKRAIWVFRRIGK
jgi:16S rRNA (guanine527-N7)-methyltransferase